MMQFCNEIKVKLCLGSSAMPERCTGGMEVKHLLNLYKDKWSPSISGKLKTHERSPHKHVASGMCHSNVKYFAVEK
jgi:hypothetical protein